MLMEKMAVPERQLVWLKVTNLWLDNENPRLPPNAKRMSQNDLLKIFEQDFDLVPVAQSMADNGYFIEEPLVVIPKSGDTYTVVEGNRRLAALKFLTDPAIRRFARDRDIWERLAKSLKYDLSKVPAIIYGSRDELVALLGFRHIAGILKWDPLAKARFVSMLVKKKGKEADFSEIARETGSRKSTIRDNYITYSLYLQARDQFEIDTSKLENNFSVFYRVLSSEPMQRFIGLNKNKSVSELKSPVSRVKAEALKELIGYIHGTREVMPVITDSRQLARLGEILESPEALDYLRRSRNFELAYALTGGEERRLIKNLKNASLYLDEALKDAHRHKESSDVVRWIERCAGAMLEILRNFPAVKTKLGLTD